MRCLTCNRSVPAAESRFLPFCSDRCRLIDLGRWLGEEHSVPCMSTDDDDPDDEPDASARHDDQGLSRPQFESDIIERAIRLPPGWHDA